MNKNYILFFAIILVLSTLLIFDKIEDNELARIRLCYENNGSWENNGCKIIVEPEPTIEEKK